MTAAASPWAGLCAPAGKPDLREQVTNKPKARQQRTAFDGPGDTSAVTLAVKPRQAAYKAGPGIHVVGGAQGRRDAEMRRAMRMTRI